MLGFGGGSENEQRFWNFVLLKVPLTDEEFSYVGGALAVILVIVGAGAGIYFFIKWLTGPA